MMILFVVLSFVMVFILIWQQIQHKKLVREIDYITSRLDTISVISENGFVLIPTDNDSIKKLSAALNKLLQDFYTKKSQFEQSKQAMAKVLTNISHDIRTPLTVLKGNSEMLSNITNTYSASENVHAMAVKIDQKADDLISTINDYFTMSKITSGDFSIKMKKENISRICQDTILDYYDLLEQKQFEVNIQIPDTPIFAYTDNEALQRILKNLIDNAIRRIDEVLHLVDLQNVEKKQVCHYSLGMKQRLAIARAILAKPEFLILDEPINALDPEGIREMRTLFQRLNQEDGTTIFISSHILSEVDLLADTIGIIQHGKLLTELPIEEIHKHQTDYISLQVDDVTRVAALLENMRITNFSVLDKEFIHIYDSDISGKALSKAIIENGIGLESMGRKQDTLEDFFFQLTEEEK